MKSPVDVAIYFLYYDLDGSDGEEGTFLHGVAAANGWSFANEVYDVLRRYNDYFYEIAYKEPRGIMLRYNDFFRKYEIVFTDYNTGDSKTIITLSDKVVKRAREYFDRSNKWNGISFGNFGKEYY